MKIPFLFQCVLLAVSACAASRCDEIQPRYEAPYPEAVSKKGLQVEHVGDALELGVKHAALNFNLSQLIDPGQKSGNPSWERDGEKYFFEGAYLRGMDQQIKPLSDHGVIVNMILLAYESSSAEVNRIALHPDYSQEAPNKLGAFNTATDEGRAWFTAAMEFIAERWSRPGQEHGRVHGYILGNEVNSHWWWSNMGRVTMEEFTGEYLKCARMAHEAIRSQSSWARLYLSLEHHWMIRFPAGDEMQCFAGRPFLQYFAKRAKAEGDFPWHLAYHPYPENLFDPKFWEDESAMPGPDTPRITFKNLEVLTEFMRRPEMLYEGRPRRIILSEQGFHTPEGPDGELIQAAAYAYAYRKVEATPEIDSFILHRHQDHPREGGLLLGLRHLRMPGETLGRKKKIYDVFKAADTDQWRQAFEFALPIIGLEKWPEAARTIDNEERGF